jgi:hypothetical protein
MNNLIKNLLGISISAIIMSTCAKKIINNYNIFYLNDKYILYYMRSE